MITVNMIIMFAIGFAIFVVYMFMLLKAIMWGHKSQEQERLNDPELRNYYARHGQGDLYDYDGMGNYGRFPNNPYKKTNSRKKVK
tara:strand:- start:1076 stop:1330 length:255 start_codon:yes stop_codon:yes gene_type:complete